MGVISNKISKEKLNPGDHIYTWRTAFLYAHHGIYVDDGKVIHFTETNFGKVIVSSSPCSVQCLNCIECPRDNGVMISTLDCFLAEGTLYRYEYSVSLVAFLAKPRGGACTLAASDPPEEVLSRAKTLLLLGVFGDYHLLRNNCENFALYCKTGLVGSKKTGQANSVSAASVAAFGFLCVGLTTVSVGTYCYGRLVSDIGWPGRKDVKKVHVESFVAK